jgi:hypothetical protein
MKKPLIKLLSLVLLVFFFHTCNEPFNSSVEPWDQTPGISISVEKVQSVMEIQNRITDALFRNPEVVGTGTGLDEKGNPAIVVYTLSALEHRPDITIETVGRGKRPTALPVSVENTPVVSRVTGMFKVYADPSSRFPRPVPIGVSTGHPDITAGTIGCRVKDSKGNVYALSNNHIFANSNNASIGDNILQPGPYDGGTNPEDAIGTLYDFEPIDFSKNNLMDAAIALCSTATLSFSTPAGDAYGAPGTLPVAATIGQSVRKYGRTTLYTTGTVEEVNVTVQVCYVSNGATCIKSARFVNQIAVSPGTFSGGGDSGSLIVTNDDNKNPVGLLFAGSTARTLANPIGDVLSRFGVTIDNGGEGTVDLTDIAVTSIDAPGDMAQGNNADIVVTVTNTGNINISNDIQVLLDDETDNINIGTQTISGGLTAGESKTFTYNWDTGAASIGVHTLTASHNLDADDDPSNDSKSTTVNVYEPSSSDNIILSATGSKARGRYTVNLTWDGADGDKINILRDGILLINTINSGSYTDTGTGGGGSYSYQVCEEDGSVCSNTVTVYF